ncbi:MAG: PASTA domain-containing protein [Bacteroidales bacterium]|nr:PASTA domain-containing protein [Porphyromonas sp.]MDD6934675.1 PASTA domain-containing protein [Bacteroidales bacterium]MDY3101593.1 PASTA domain-containing protein [Porphyromonas sp.]
MNWKDWPFIRKHPILSSLLAMLGVSAVILLIVFLLMSIYTQHGEAVTIPELKGLPYDEAVEKLEDAGLRYEVIDSNYVENMKPGTVFETIPESGSRVKPRRIIFLTINAFCPRMIALPEVEGQSARHANALLEGLGFTNVGLKRVDGQYNGLVVGIANDKGEKLAPGSKVPLKAHLTLLVTSDALSFSADSLAIQESLFAPTVTDSTQAEAEIDTRDVAPIVEKDEPEEWW